MPDQKTEPSTEVSTGVLYYGDNIQIFTVAELLEGKQPELPSRVPGFARAPKVRRRTAQITLQFSSAKSGAKLKEDE